MAKEINPRLGLRPPLRRPGHDRLGRPTGSKRELYRKSILDFVLEDAQQLRGRLGLNDRRKLDEYLTSVREIEQRIARADDATADLPRGRRPGPAGIPKDYREHIRLMFDLMALAFQTDITRICTFMYANEGATRPYPIDRRPRGPPRPLAPRRRPQEAREDPEDQPVPHRAVRLPARQAEGRSARATHSVLDNSMIVYGSGISDGNRHNHDDLPVLLAGKGGGTIKTGRHIKYSPQPLNNLYLSHARPRWAPPSTASATARAGCRSWIHEQRVASGPSLQ